MHETIFALRLTTEERMRLGKLIHIASVDSEKLFDNVGWNKMFDVSQKTDMKFKNRKIMYNLYKKPVTIVRIDNEEGESKIGKGVRQGYSLLITFSLHTKKSNEQSK